MSGKTRQLLASENGFTLVELLTVMSIIGSLAAIALPNFTGQQVKGQDADAKSNARNAVTAVESCFTDTGAYDECDTAGEIEAAGIKVGMPFTDTVTKAKGAVTVTATPDTYTVVSYSASSGEFSVSKAADGTSNRSW